MVTCCIDDKPKKPKGSIIVIGAGASSCSDTGICNPFGKYFVLLHVVNLLKGVNLIPTRKLRMLLEMEEMILEESKFDNDNYGGGK